MHKPYVYVDRKLGNKRSEFEAKSSQILDGFKTKELFIPQEKIIPFIEFLRKKDITTVNPYLLEKIKEIKEATLLAQPSLQVKLLYKEKIYYQDLSNEIEAKNCRGLTVLEHCMFDYLFPAVHNHSQVVSFETHIPHGVPGLGQLGMRSFCYRHDWTSSLYYTCLFKDQTFKDVFVPIVAFQQPDIGRNNYYQGALI